MPLYFSGGRLYGDLVNGPDFVRAAARTVATVAFVVPSPRIPTEMALAEIWAAALCLDRFGVDEATLMLYLALEELSDA